jgi:two-component system cell cycle sensor histidine kinase/response regulator CckA
MNEEPMQPASLPECFHEALLDQSAAGVLVFNARGQVIYANPAASTVLHLQQEDLPGRPLEELLETEPGQQLSEAFQRALEGCPREQLQVQLPTGPSHRHLVVELVRMECTDDQAANVAAWIVDNTAGRDLTERLAQAEKMASLGTLAGGVAHHFNNILGGVATFVDYALTSGDTVAMKRALQMTAEAASRASRITQSLLSFTKHESLQPDLADLTEVVLTFSHLVERPLAEKDIELVLDVQPVPVIPVEANYMHQVLGQLLSNAEEAMAQGGRIELSLRSLEKDKLVELSFADSGVGIEEQYLSQVFEPFFTTKGLLAGGDQGNPGLGLSIVHGKVLEMGGTIDVESSPGEGTRFVLRFPLPPPLQD